MGSNSGLTRYRDTASRCTGRPKGCPSDEPNTVFQDRTGRIWVGFHDAGLMLFSPGGNRVFTTRDGLPNNEIFSIRAGGERRPADRARAAAWRGCTTAASPPSCRPTRWRG